MSKETFTRDKPHVNIARIGGGALLLILIVFAASTFIRGQDASITLPTDTLAPGPTSAPTNTSQGSASGSLVVNQLWGDWFLYVDPCGGSFPVLQTAFKLRNDGPEPVSMTESTLMVTYFEVSPADSPDSLPGYIQVFTMPHFPSSSNQDATDAIPPGGEIQVVLEFSPFHPDFMWTPTRNPAPTATTSSGGGGGGNNYTFYGRYFATSASLTREDAVENTLWGDWFIIDEPASTNDVPPARLILPYFPALPSGDSSASNQLWGDYVYLDVGTSEDSGGISTPKNILWGDYQYDIPPGGSPTGFKDASVSVVLLPEIAGLFKDTADGEPASPSNITLERGITADSLPTTRDSGMFWFFNADNVELITESIGDDHIGAYHFLLEIGDEDFPVIIAQLPNAEEEDKRPPMTLVLWGSKFPQQTNQTNLSFIQRLGQRAGYATVSGAPENIRLVEVADPSRCLTPTSTSIDSSSPSPTDTLQPGQSSPTPTNTLQPSRTPEPGRTKPSPTNTLQPSRTPQSSKPTPTPTKDGND